MKGIRPLVTLYLYLKMGFYHLKWEMENSVSGNEHRGFSMYFWGYGNVKKKRFGGETNCSKSIFEKAEQLRRDKT